MNLNDQPEILAQMAEPGNEDFRIPHNMSEARAALSLRRGKNAKRRVAWYSFPVRRGYRNHDYDIHVKDGNELYLTVYSGIPFLHVRTGHVTVEFRSSWGNSITVHDGASAHVIVPSPDTKVTITVEPGGTYTMDIPEGKHRVYYPEKYSNLLGQSVFDRDPLEAQLDALAADNAMQAAMHNAQQRTGNVVLDSKTTPDGVVIETIPFTPLTDDDFDQRRGDGWDASSISD